MFVVLWVGCLGDVDCGGLMLLARLVWVWLTVWWLFLMVVAFALLLVLGCCWFLGLLLIGFGVVGLVLLVFWICGFAGFGFWICWFWVLVPVELVAAPECSVLGGLVWYGFVV